MKVIHYDRAPRQHVIYGPSAPIVQKITPDNWQEVAIIRGGQYIYIAREYTNWEKGKNWLSLFRRMGNRLPPETGRWWH